MASSTRPLPTPGHSITETTAGHDIRVSAIAANRWRIGEAIGDLLVGYGELVVLNGSYAISTPSGFGPTSSSWTECLEDYLARDAA